MIGGAPTTSKISANVTASHVFYRPRLSPLIIEGATHDTPEDPSESEGHRQIGW